MRTTRRSRLALLLAAVPILLPSSARAQDADPWDWSLLVGGSAFFGDVDQTAVTFSGTVARADSTLELEAQLKFDYAETHDVELDRTVVSRRSWLGGLSADLSPESTWSPFGFGTGERSYEKRIDFRYNLGGGAKYTFVSDPVSRIDLSAAVLAEQTNPSGPNPTEDVLARLSLRFRLRHVFGSGDPAGNLRFDTTNRASPQVDDFGNYTVLSRSALDYPLTSVLAIGLSFEYEYDSLARDRGAVSNHSGEIFLNFRAQF